MANHESAKTTKLYDRPKTPSRSTKSSESRFEPAPFQFSGPPLLEG